MRNTDLYKISCLQNYNSADILIAMTIFEKNYEQWNTISSFSYFLSFLWHKTQIQAIGNKQFIIKWT